MSAEQAGVRSGVGSRETVILIAMTLMLTLLPAVTALADLGDPPPPETHQAAGSGELEGTELVQDEGGIPCIRATRTLFGVRGAGTFEGRTPSGDGVVYRAQTNTGQTLYGDGPLQVQLENNEAYYHSPFGTHGTESGGGAGCSPSTAGTPVPSEFRIFAADGAQDTDGDTDVDVLTGSASVYRLNDTGDKVPCVGVGSFARGKPDNAGAWWAEWTLSADCVVVANEGGTPGTGTAPRGTFMTHHGGHAPCSDTCSANLKIDYRQYLPKPGPYLHLTGPATATVGCDESVALTARLTDTGWPAGSVPVSFSVAGPGPAVPPSGEATTDDNGTAGFSFTAATAGDYTVTATAIHGGEQVSATRTVRFTDPPPANIALAGPDSGQTEEQLTVTATVTNACGPLPGAPVDFGVEWSPQDRPWTGQATPSSGSAVTDADGRASYSFSGDRTGDYRVTSSARTASGQVSDSHTAHLEIRNFKRVGAITVPEKDLDVAVVDPNGDFAYFGNRDGEVVKVSLATFERISAITLTRPGGGAISLTSAVIDPAGRFVYFADDDVFKIDLETFEQVGWLDLDANDRSLKSAVIDPAGAFAYFGSSSPEGKIVKVDLATFTRVGAIDTRIGDQDLGEPMSGVMDPAGRFAYFGTQSGRVVRVDLAAFVIADVITLARGEAGPVSAAIIDPAGDFAYFGILGQPGRIVKIDLRRFQRVAAITFPERIWYESPAVIDPAGGYAYFGVDDAQGLTDEVTPLPARVVKVDLRTFERVHAITLDAASDERALASAVIDPDGGYAYFGTNYPSSYRDVATSDRVVKVQLKRLPSPALAADPETYTTPYATPLTVPAPGVLEGDTDADGDPLVAGQASDPANGSVALEPDGSFTYTADEGFAGTDTFTYTASDGMDYSAPATVTITVAGPQGLTGSAYGFSSSVSLFGGTAEPRGPAPSVTLPPAGSSTPVSATAPTGDAVYGPADIFTSGQLDVSTEGTLGPGGSVASSTEILNVNRDGNEVFTAAEVTSTCDASQTGAGASTTITGGTLRTSEGDPNVDGDDTVVTIPPRPDPNTTYEGALETVGDRFRYVFNEQITNDDGSITVYAAHQYLLGPTAIGDLYIGKATCGVPATSSDPSTLGVVADFDGDGDTDRSVFRAGAWYVEGQTTAYFGLAGDLAVPGDYDGDGDLDRAVYRGGAWLTEGGPTVYLGTPDDVPVPGDYDGDGDTDRAVFRASVGAWFIEGQPTQHLGGPGDIAVPGDYDGDGTTEVAVWRPSSGGWYVAGQATQWLGLDGDVPVPGDYDGNGATEAAVWRPSGGAWHVAGQPALWLGLSGDVPVPGDYDGDGTTDRAVWRPGAGAWHVEGTPAAHLGADGDQPLPLPAAVYRALG